MENGTYFWFIRIARISTLLDRFGRSEKYVQGLDLLITILNHSGPCGWCQAASGDDSRQAQLEMVSPPGQAERGAAGGHLDRTWAILAGPCV